MKFILDTNICICLIRKRPASVVRRLIACTVGDVGISSVTLAELQYGVEKSSRPQQNQSALAEFVAPLMIFPFDESAAVVYGKVRMMLERRGQTIGPMDLMIGAHALSLGRTLVTNNIREFSRIERLELENWVH